MMVTKRRALPSEPRAVVLPWMQVTVTEEALQGPQLKLGKELEILGPAAQDVFGAPERCQ